MARRLVCVLAGRIRLLAGVNCHAPKRIVHTTYPSFPSIGHLNKTGENRNAPTTYRFAHVPVLCSLFRSLFRPSILWLSALPSRSSSHCLRMMYGFGDEQHPLPETVAYMQEVLVVVDFSVHIECLFILAARQHLPDADYSSRNIERRFSVITGYITHTKHNPSDSCNEVCSTLYLTVDGRPLPREMASGFEHSPFFFSLRKFSQENIQRLDSAYRRPVLGCCKNMVQHAAGKTGPGKRRGKQRQSTHTPVSLEKL